MKNVLLLIIFILLLPFSAVQATDSYRFRTMSPEGGFSFDGVKSVLQDDEGFIWVLIEDELYRYDGYEYKMYHSRFTIHDVTDEWLFHNMTVSSDGKLFVATNHGLYVYNKNADTFDVLWKEYVDLVEIDAQNRIWIRNIPNWRILDVEKKTLYRPLYDGDSISYVTPNFCVNRDDLYQITNYGKIFRFDPKTHNFSLLMRMPETSGRVLSARAYQDKLWVLVAKFGLYKIDLATQKIEAHFNYSKSAELIFSNRFLIDKNGHIWFATRNGIEIFDPEKGSFTSYQHDEDDPYSLPSNSVWTINEDRQKNVWVGMYSGILSYVNLDEKRAFGTLYPMGYKKMLNHRVVSAFAEDQQSLWIGTEGGGINRMNKTTGQFTYLTHTDANSLSSNYIKSLVVDNRQNVWIATFLGGLDCYNPKTNQFQHFVHIPKDNNSLLHNDIRKILLEGDEGLWILYQNYGMKFSYYSFKTQTFTHYNYPDGNKKYYLFDMVRGEGNQLWLIDSKKLYCMDVATHIIKEMPRKDTSDKQFFMNFFTVSRDTTGNLWIGTIGNGLVKYNPHTSDFTIYDDILKYNLSSIYSICCGDHETIWLGTDNGLFRYDIKNNTYSHYDTQDEAQGRVYYPFAVARSADGKLYFGGTNGFTIVDPTVLTRNNYKPKVLLTEFLIDNKPVQWGKAIGKSEITLNYTQTNFGFRFASDNYLIPRKTQYKYRLKGYDKDWIEIKASNRTALYAKVPSGNYTFEVLAANNDGVWSDTPTVVTIHVKPAPWFSLPALILYILIALALLYWGLRTYLHNVEKKKEDELQKIQIGFYKNYFVNTAELSSNERERKFLEDFVKIVDEHLDQPKLDVNFIASEMTMSRSSLYNKVKSLTGKSIVEFILHQRLRKAANLMVETDMTMRQIMNEIGIESQSYFSNAFKKEFGETPTVFVSKHK